MSPLGQGFYGSYEGKFDGKNRLALPAKIRSAADGEWALLFLYITPETSIRILSESEWARLQGRLASYGTTNEDANRYYLTMMNLSAEIGLDTQGRILVTERLLRLAGVDDKHRDVSIMGMGQRIDIWSVERMEAFKRARVYEVDEIFGPYREAAKRLVL